MGGMGRPGIKPQSVRGIGGGRSGISPLKIEYLD